MDFPSYNNSTIDCPLTYHYNGERGFRRFDINYTTCNTLYENFFDGFFYRSKDTYFFLNTLTFVIVTFIYFNIGGGRYWKILFYSSVCGFLGSILEACTVACICRKSKEKEPYYNVYSFFVAEFFWICNEYSIPFLNLIKMNTFAGDDNTKFINWIIGCIFPLFSFCRFWIGYVRSRDGILYDLDINYSHGLAFSFMGIADLTCTISILYFVKKNNNGKKYIKSSTISHYIKRSNYIILICVDIVSVMLAISFFLSRATESIPESIMYPFHCIKCSFILILACDALLFKYEIKTNSRNRSEYEYDYKNHVSLYDDNEKMKYKNYNEYFMTIPHSYVSNDYKINLNEFKYYNQYHLNNDNFTYKNNNDNDSDNNVYYPNNDDCQSPNPMLIHTPKRNRDSFETLKFI
ncbi:hypothetical protein BCR32DRAFT_293369 [Anaeromyces robustus]|uniref:Uncharacterized protein n=1 Tax=Anaeromyces robustus TaxID=1754192 RepID=A0A1Y1X6J4_9FUNG|nr:hypothetical protein BCR32DRAFT_293369 [Anaeromyces robustus]|eukprot:ORX81295.1 hypothetical protein BCR32DRAFT_293369 [Anaeromyces robustus]